MGAVALRTGLLRPDPPAMHDFHEVYYNGVVK